MMDRDTKLIAILRRQYHIILTALEENIFRIWASMPIWPVYLIVKCNDGAVVPQPNWYQD